MDEVVDEAVSLGVAGEAVLAAVACGRWRVAQGVGDPPVEAFDHAVGLRRERSGEPVLDAAPGAQPVEGMTAGGLAGRLVLHVDGRSEEHTSELQSLMRISYAV